MTAVPGYLADLARLLGVENPLHLVTETTLCDELVVPQDICNLDHRLPVSAPFQAWLAERRPARGGTSSGRVYVSRSRLAPDRGHYLQERVLEAALQRNGYRIFHPQEHPLAEQIEVLATAGQLIFADGSAAHLWSLGAQGGQDVAVILRRPLDRPFARWFRCFGGAMPQFLDFGLADFMRRGEGLRRSVALVDMEAIWDRLRQLGFHRDDRGTGIDRAAILDWLSDGAGRITPPPAALDDWSHQILALRKKKFLRAGSPGEGPQVAVVPPEGLEPPTL